MVQKFRKKPVMIEAMQWRGPDDDSALGQFLGKWKWYSYMDGRPRIKTLESGTGFHFVDANDWIIRGVKGEFYPCKPDAFEISYEPVEGPA